MQTFEQLETLWSPFQSSTKLWKNQNFWLFPWLKLYSQYKLEKKSTPCIFLGCSKNQSAYIYFDLTTNKTYISRHVLFDEQNFPFQQLQSTNLDACVQSVQSHCLVTQRIGQHKIWLWQHRYHNWYNLLPLLLINPTSLKFHQVCL